MNPLNLHDLPPTLTIDLAAELLGISRRSAYRAVERGDLPVLRLGRRMLVPVASQEWWKRGRSAGSW